jgi:membrane associated rhomboid family serine protease
MVLDINVKLFTMCPRLVLYLQEYYRVISSCFFHGSLLHIGMNLMSTAAISTMIERRLGTLTYILTVAWAVILTGVLYVSIAWLSQAVLGRDELMHSHALGFSGIMFHLLVLESNLIGPNASRSVFGIVNVPSYAYPMVMLVVMQVIMPNISFTGHLCGIVTGTLHLYGLLDGVLVNQGYLQEMEQWRLLRGLTSKDTFVPTPMVTAITTTNSNGESLRRDPRALLTAIRRGCQLILSFLFNILETIQISIFGRGRRANANTYIAGTMNTRSRSPRQAPTTTTATNQMEDSSTKENQMQEYDEEGSNWLPKDKTRERQQSQLL